MVPNSQTNDKLKEMRRRSMVGGGEKRIAKQHEKGKLTARERLTQLLDPASFHELEGFCPAFDNTSNWK